MSEHTAMQQDIRELSARARAAEAGIRRFMAVWDSFPPDHLDEAALADAVEELRTLVPEPPQQRRPPA